MEPTEIEEFRKQVEEGGESGLTYVSLAISILAVLVAMVTVLGHRTHTEAVLQQSRASDQWNEYQAKKIRQNEESIASSQLTLQSGPLSPAAQKQLDTYKSHIEKTDKDLKEEQQQAEDFEADVKRAESAASRYDLGEALLQISVVLTSITLLTRKKAYALMGLALGAVGLIIAASVFFLH